ncbi:divergent PAP2 family protein [Paenibacillus puerhi]|uniref:divergent PAP2 family protein n=1 Tax=Paenibacillus puerhi TaxID=2692622 RepID=UPI001F181B17|nr:divergent PAP2 family protein [Paenibacillus puerhi]
MYALAPLIGWLVAGSLKFAINHLRYGNARERIGNGGFPSTHTTIVATTAALIGFGEGFDSAAFGLGVAVVFIVIIDATGLRRHVGRHAEALNGLRPEGRKLRVSMGHSALEVIGGLALGGLLGYGLSLTGW